MREIGQSESKYLGLGEVLEILVNHPLRLGDKMVTISTSKSEARVLDQKKLVCFLQVKGEPLPPVE